MFYRGFESIEVQVALIIYGSSEGIKFFYDSSIYYAIKLCLFKKQVVLLLASSIFQILKEWKFASRNNPTNGKL